MDTSGRRGSGRDCVCDCRVALGSFGGRTGIGDAMVADASIRGGLTATRRLRLWVMRAVW
jgi:hypothetical protein